MKSTRPRSLAAAMVAGAVAALATQAEPAPAHLASRTATPVERTVELMEALKRHRYKTACGVYDPVFWEMVGFASPSCPEVLAQTFPRRMRVAYRVEFGGTIGPRMAVVIVSMALDDAARPCDEAWARAQHCPRASTYYLELTRKTLPIDWRRQGVAAPRDQWYVSAVGGV
jgi:hypothetical protein